MNVLFSLRSLKSWSQLWTKISKYSYLLLQEEISNLWDEIGSKKKFCSIVTCFGLNIDYIVDTCTIQMKK
jgi:hypothetical protein